MTDALAPARSACVPGCTRARRCWPRRATSATTFIAPPASPPPATAARCSSRRQRPASSRSSSPTSASTASRTSAAPERVYQLGDGAFPALKSLYRTNLPVPATTFLGREQELAEVAELLQDGARLLTLTGPGGTGKTRLAIHAAAEAADSFPDGIWWVPMASLRDANLLVSSVAQALGVEEQPGRELAESVAAQLTGKQTLLMLDNAEHLMPEVASKVAELRDIAGPTLLVTSRERLQLQGEHVYSVPSLDDGGRSGALPHPRAGAAIRSRRVGFGGRALLAPGQPSAGARARRRPDRRLLAGAARRSTGAAARPAQGGPGRRSAAADAPGDDRVVVRPARSRGAAPVPRARRVRRRRTLRVGRGSVRRRPRHAPVAHRQEPRPAARRDGEPALLDARDDPRARRGAARDRGRGSRAGTPARRALPRGRTLGEPRCRRRGRRSASTSSSPNATTCEPR